MFTHNILNRIKELFLETFRQMEVELIEFGGEDDHVHLLVTVPPKLPVSNLVGKLKGKSAYFLRKEYHTELKKKLWGKHLWSPSYCVVSCGGAPLNIVKAYVENQRKAPNQKAINQAKRATKNNACLTRL